MINMMYLVFIAMLALQISKEVLATLGILSEDMEKSTAELKASIDSAYNIIDQNSNQDYYKIPSEELPKLKEITDEYFTFLQDLKDSLIGIDENNYWQSGPRRKLFYHDEYKICIFNKWKMDKIFGGAGIDDDAYIGFEKYWSD